MFKYASGNFYAAINVVVVVVGTKCFFIAVLCVWLGCFVETLRQAQGDSGAVQMCQMA